jgi:hypothetical protein
MLKRTRFIAALGAVLLVAAVGGVLGLTMSSPGTSAVGDRAEVTGYATSNAFGDTTGPVSVELHGASAASIDRLAEGLPAANVDDICTIEVQMYQITFTVGAGAKRGLDVIGYQCGGVVVEVPSPGLTSNRVDRNCVLLAAVRRLLPASATATQSGGCGLSHQTSSTTSVLLTTPHSPHLTHHTDPSGWPGYRRSP